MKRWGWIILVGVCAAACDNTHTPCEVDSTCAGVTEAALCGDLFCTAGAQCGTTIYVWAAAKQPGVGSRQAPFRQLAAAVTQARPGDCIALAQGKYTRARLPGGISLLGSGADRVSLSSADTTRAALQVEGGRGGTIRGLTLSGAGRGLVISDCDDLRLEQLRVESVREVGVDVRRSLRLVARHLTVRGVLPNTSGLFGVGVLIAEGSDATIDRLAIDGSAAEGLLVSSSRLDLSASTVSGSGALGLAIDCRGACRSAAQLSTINNVTLDRNGGGGLWVFGATLQVDTLSIGHSTMVAGLSRGVEIVGGANVALERLHVHHGAGAGVLIDGSSGSLVDSTIANNDERGVWLQDIASGFSIRRTEVSECSLVGIGVLASRGVELEDGRIANVRLRQTIAGSKTLSVGDGMQLLAKSEASVRALEISGAARVGLLIDDARARVADSTIAGGKAQLVVQNAPISPADFANNKDEQGRAVTPLTPPNPFGITPDHLVLRHGISPLPLP